MLSPKVMMRDESLARACELGARFTTRIQQTEATVERGDRRSMGWGTNLLPEGRIFASDLLFVGSRATTHGAEERATRSSHPAQARKRRKKPRPDLWNLTHQASAWVSGD